MWPLVIAVGSLLLSAYLAPKAKSDSVKADLSSVKVPTIEDGTPHRVIFGKPWIKGELVVWWGDKRADPIVKKGGKK